MKNAVIDTNVIVRGLIGSPVSRALFRAFKAERFKLFISPPLLREIIHTLNKPRLRPLIDSKERNDILLFIQERAIFVNPQEVIFESRDTKDNIVLECATEAKADFIVTLDNDLLVLKSFRDIPIVEPEEFLTHISKE
jgi:putative PIN family toxin of toxin-antitoxin system